MLLYTGRTTTVMCAAMQAVLLKPHLVKRTKRTRGVSTHSPLVDVACGSYSSYAFDEEGHVWAWGLNQYGQLGLSELVLSANLRCLWSVRHHKHSSAVYTSYSDCLPQRRCKHPLLACSNVQF